SSTPLLKWLNALPEVRAVMAQEFGGKAIGRHNLFEWRHGGLAEWRQQQQARQIVERLHADGNELTKVADGSVANITAQWLAVRYVVGLKQLKGRDGADGLAWERLRECCHDVLALQRSEQLAQRLEFEREKLANIKAFTDAMVNPGTPHPSLLPSEGRRDRGGMSEVPLQEMNIQAQRGSAATKEDGGSKMADGTGGSESRQPGGVKITEALRILETAAAGDGRTPFLESTR
ncbi:MAG: hypothetical protein P4N60_15545, partial [Verrucomicrobiae bacterium]|nr:hypothetical protein [Verrucomicrobiae bacterium]